MKTNKVKLLMSCGALAVLGASLLQGCSSSDDSSTTTGGTSAGGTAAGGRGGSGTAGKTGTGGSGTAGSGTAGSGTAGKSGTAGTGTGGTGAAGEPGSEGGEPGAAGAPGGDGKDCTQFCADEETTCTFDTSDKAPYTASTACMAACAGFALGTVGVYPAGDASGDTYACRRWHLSAAAQTGPVATHCPHTGAVSKSHYADTSATGPCTGAAP